MTVIAQTPTNSYLANGVATVCAFSFLVLDDGDLVVQLTDTAGDTTTKALGVDYTVTGIGTLSGGSVTFSVAPPLGYLVKVFRQTALARSTDYQDNGDLYADTVNDDFDRIWLALQELSVGATGLATAVRVPVGETITALPSVVDRAGKFLYFNSQGNPTVSDGSTGAAAVNLAVDYDWTGSHTFNAGDTADPAILVPTYPTTRIARTSPAGGSGLVRSPFIIDHKASADTDAFEWSMIVRNSNYADDTAENVAIYGQAYKYHLQGNSFAGVFEAQDFSGDSSTGILCALEMDLFGNGSNAASRVGAQLVLGKANAGGAQFVARAAFEVAPQGEDKTKAKLSNAIDIRANVDGALIRQSNSATAAYAIDFLNGGGVTEFIRFYSGAMPAFQLVGAGGSLGTYVGRLKINIDDTASYWLPIYG